MYSPSWKFFSALVVISALLFGGCSKENLFTGSNAISIDAAIQPYFDAFITEAAARHLDLAAATQSVNAEIRTLTSENGQKVIGMCTAKAGDHTITVDKTYWSQATPLLREFLIFHELGHCVLQREHLDTKNTNGTCTSIMHSGSTNCRNIYSSATRKAYLDELFGEY